MKLILLEDVKNQGKKGQIIDVSEGYAKNFLLPKKLAVEATKANMDELNRKKAVLEEKKAQEIAKAKLLAESLKETGVTIKVKSGENGKLFGAVTNKEIAQALLDQTGIEIDKKKILLDEPIKNTGVKQVDIKIHSEINAKIKVIIVEG